MAPVTFELWTLTVILSFLSAAGPQKCRLITGTWQQTQLDNLLSADAFQVRTNGPSVVGEEWKCECKNLTF